MWLAVASSIGAAPALARGVSPYLPLHQSPEIERKIERLLILADRPVLTRPIAAATVLTGRRNSKADGAECRQKENTHADHRRVWPLVRPVCVRSCRTRSSVSRSFCLYRSRCACEHASSPRRAHARLNW